MDAVLEATNTFLEEDLKEVEELLASVHRVEGVLMQEVADYVRAGHGKMLRPIVSCLAARLFERPGNPSPNRTRVAAASELIHAATLLHDDVIDKAPLRRGRPTVNARWGDDVAILMADYLYATAYDLLLSTLRPEAIRIFAKVTQEMTYGEMFQIETRDHWLRVDEYMKIIRNKTARLFSACTGLGALVGGAAPEEAKRAAEFGLHFGMAFQLTDDALDYIAQGDHWGKRVGSDVAEGKQTLPLLHTLLEAEDTDRTGLLACLNNGRDFATVHAYVRKYKGVEATLALAEDYAENAVHELQNLGAERPRELLCAIARGVVSRHR